MPINRDKEYLELLKKNYDNLHSAVWEAHKIFWTCTGIFAPIISGGFAWFLKEYGGNGIYLQKFLISFLLVAIIWFWYLMIRNFDGYNRPRFRQLRLLEEAFEKINPAEVPTELQFRQYRLKYQGSFNKLCRSLAVLLTGILASFLLWDISAIFTWGGIGFVLTRSIAGAIFIFLIMILSTEHFIDG